MVYMEFSRKPHRHQRREQQVRAGPKHTAAAWAPAGKINFKKDPEQAEKDMNRLLR